MDALLLLGAIVGGGMYLENEKKKNNKDYQLNNSNTNLPYHNNLYDTNNYEMSKSIEEVKASDIISDMINNSNTNVVDTTQTYNNQHRLGNLNVGEDDKIYSQALDSEIDKGDFLRDDRGVLTLPHFSGNNSPNVDLNNNYGFQASMGGAAATSEWKPKMEVENMGDWYMEDNIHGRQWGEGIDSDFNRYVPGTMRSGELPFEQQRIQHIDEKSFDNRLIDEAIANTTNIDKLRTLNNPKKTYTGRVIDGERINLRGIEGKVDKNRTEKYHELGEDRNLVTTGAVLASSKRPLELVPETNRQHLNKMQMGAAAPIDGITEHSDRPFVSKSMKQPLDPDNSRNISGGIRIIDHDRLGYRTYPNERQITEERTYEGNVKGVFEGRTIGLQDDIKKTIKETTLDPANNGFLTGENEKLKMYNMDGARRTVKETTVGANDMMNLKGGNTDNLQVRPLDEAKTTIKEGTMYNKKGISGSYLSEEMSRENYDNSESNPTKEIISSGAGRMPTLSSTKVFNGGDTVNIDIKKIESDYLTQHKTGIGKIYDNYKPKEKTEITNDKNTYNDAELLLNQLDPQILNPFKSNPYTKSLESYNY